MNLAKALQQGIGIVLAGQKEVARLRMTDAREAWRLRQKLNSLTRPSRAEPGR